MLRKDILLKIVNVVTNRAITFQFAMGATTHIKGRVRSIVRTKCLSSQCRPSRRFGGQRCTTNSPSNHFGNQRFEGEGII